MKIIELNDGSGFPPRLRTAADKLKRDIWTAIAEASDAGMPLSMLLGVFDMTKDDLIRYARMSSGGTE